MSSATSVTSSTGLQGYFASLRAKILEIALKRPYGKRDMPRRSIEEVFPGIYLGEELALRDLIRSTEDFEDIDKVFTLCLTQHLEDTGRWCRAQSSQQTEDTIKECLSKRNAKWIHVGKDLGDQESAWPVLVAASTFPDLDPKVAQAKVRELPCDQWFESVFKRMDDSLLNKKAFFVHCQMGISRAPAFLCAYLIKRCDVTARQALALLQYRRLCVLTNFLSPLEEYKRGLDRIAKPIDVSCSTEAAFSGA